MISKLPIIGPSVSLKELLCAFRYSFNESICEKFKAALFKFIPCRYIYLTNSGIASFYIILKTLKEKSARREVILPAYTAGSLVVGIIKAGLRPVLCDISLDDFNLDTVYLSRIISRDTLAVLAVHMFGVVMKDMDSLKKKLPGETFLIEDCAQAMGSKIGQNYAGNFGDISFFSFNRGKNLPLCGGGCIATATEGLAQAIEKSIQKLEADNRLLNLLFPFRHLALSFAVNPYFYGLGYGLISHFKENVPPDDFAVKKINSFYAGLGLALLSKLEEFYLRRHQKAEFLLNALNDIPGIILPKIRPDAFCAFNRFPVLFKDISKREKAQRILWKNGIEASPMYLRPLHHMFELGYDRKDFPNSVYFAEHLLTLPVHPLVKEEDLLRMVRIIREI